jgi:type I restriction-modification system DNA methylase subunit
MFSFVVNTRDVILPMVVLRRLDALLEPTKEAVEEEIKEELEVMKLEEIDCDALCSVTGLSYYNTSKWTLNRLKSQASIITIYSMITLWSILMGSVIMLRTC